MINAINREGGSMVGVRRVLTIVANYEEHCSLVFFIICRVLVFPCESIGFSRSESVNRLDYC